MKDSYLKDAGSRNQESLTNAENCSKQASEIINIILDESKANYIVAKSLIGLADVCMEKKEYNEAEKLYHRA
jgi:hypothetical protein